MLAQVTSFAATGLDGAATKNSGAYFPDHRCLTSVDFGARVAMQARYRRSETVMPFRGMTVTFRSDPSR